MRILCGNCAEYYISVIVLFIIMKKLSIFLISIILFIFAFKVADASIVTINKTGGVLLNVLSAEDSGDKALQPESIKVSDSSVEMGEADMPISLFRKDGKYVLNVVGKNGERSFDVSDYNDRILEIEERPSVRKIGVRLVDGQFVLEQAGVKAKTSYQINIEPQKSRITILTPSGYKFLSTLPREAVDILLRSKSITDITEDRTIEISEDQSGNLYYLVNGMKQVGIKDLYMHDVPVSAKISVTDGQIMEFNQPLWLKIIGLFTVQT